MKEVLKFSLQGSFAGLVLMALLQPFGIDRIENGRVFFILAESLCVFVSLFITMSLQQRFFPSLTSNENKTASRIALGQIPIFLFNAFLLSFFLLSFACWFSSGSAIACWYNDNGFTIRPYLSMLVQVLFMSVFVYIWVVYKAYNQSLRNELDEVIAINHLLEQRQEKENASQTPEVEEMKCIIESNTNNIKLEVDPRDIVYIESMSNYADICYLENGETKHKTLRITLKQLRESLSEASFLVSCHRAFIVNMNFVVSFSTRPSGGYQLQIFGNDKQIPVSRSCTEEIKNLLK